jgi:flagellar motor switch protein FliN/FliY
MADEQSQDQIDALMKALASGDTPMPSPPSGPGPAAGAPSASGAAPASAPAPRHAAAPPRARGPARKADNAPLAAAPAGTRPDAGWEFRGDVDDHVRVELGKTHMNVQEVLRLGNGSVVGLDSLVGDPVSVYVNDRLVARGEVMVVDDRFAVRVTEVVPQQKG